MRKKNNKLQLFKVVFLQVLRQVIKVNNVGKIIVNLKQCKIFCLIKVNIMRKGKLQNGKRNF